MNINLEVGQNLGCKLGEEREEGRLEYVLTTSLEVTVIGASSCINS